MRSLIKFLFILTLSSAAFGQSHALEKPAKVTLGSARVIVPMTLFGNKPVIQVSINGKGPFSFFLDTGAGGTVMDQSLADQIGLKSDGKMKIGDPADPQGIEANKNEIAKLSIGDADLLGFVALSWDRSLLYNGKGPLGVLGMPLFRDLLLTIDYPNSRVIIEKGSLPAANGREILPFEYSEGGIFSLGIKVSGSEMMANLDSGSGGGITFPQEMMDKVALRDKPVEVGRGRTVGGDTVVYGGKLAGDIALGSYVLTDPDVRFFGRLRHVNIGYQVIRNFAVTIDQRSRLIRFAPSTAVQAPAAQPAGKYAGFAGSYGERRITVEGDSVFLQRVSGPRGEGPKLKLTEVRSGEFSIEGVPEVRVKFNRNAAGAVESLSVLTPDGKWELSLRSK